MSLKKEHLLEIYHSRINKSIDYIEENLDKPFTLEMLATASNFSKYHFHRIFQSLIGETPFQFILRLRLERAASLLAALPKESITQIAYQCGFSDISVFSRNFKHHFKKSPTEYRKSHFLKSNNSQIESKRDHSDSRISMYFCSDSGTIKWKTNMKMNKEIEVKEIPEMTVAYVRHIGPYQGDSKLFEKLWNKLFRWAGPRGLVGGPDFKSLIVYHDDPNVTVGEKLRTSVCITVPADTKVSGEVGKMDLEASRSVVARFEVTEQEFQQAWEWVYGQWLPTSGYQPDDKPCFEVYPEEPKNGKFTVDICVPVKPL